MFLLTSSNNLRRICFTVVVISQPFGQCVPHALHSSAVSAPSLGSSLMISVALMTGRLMRRATLVRSKFRFSGRTRKNS